MVLNNILTTSWSNNLEVGVTGNLICHSDLFLQMLEGPSDVIHRLYETILADDRHANIIKLRDEKSELRVFPHGRCEMTAIKAGCYLAVR